MRTRISTILIWLKAARRLRITAFVVGIFLLVLAIVLISYLGKWHLSEIIGGGTCPFGASCSPPRNELAMRVDYSPVIELSGSVPITVTAAFSGLDTDVCEPYTKITNEIFKFEAVLHTSGLEVSPEGVRETYVLDAIRQRGGVAEWVWIAHAKDLGEYSLNVELQGVVGSCPLSHLDHTIKIKVVDLFGLTAQQARNLGLLGGFLGSALTLQGLIALWDRCKEGTEKREQKRRERREEQRRKEEEREKRWKEAWGRKYKCYVCSRPSEYWQEEMEPVITSEYNFKGTYDLRGTGRYEPSDLRKCVDCREWLCGDHFYNHNCKRRTWF